MATGREEGPVYYREIQKNAYLKRIPNDVGGSKLRPLGSKKLPLKAMWTQFCVHNGRTPYLEQYPDAECPAAMTHKPVWRACLLTARHVTASVKPHTGDQYDFLVDTDEGAVRMLAPDWDSMLDWVTTLRRTLHELKVLCSGENVYCLPPVAPAAPRAPARDPNSPLPAPPHPPPDRVPGIEITPNTRVNPEPTRPIETPTASTIIEPQPTITEVPDVDLSNWDTSNVFSIPGTSRFEPGTESQAGARNLEAKTDKKNQESQSESRTESRRFQETQSASRTSINESRRHQESQPEGRMALNESRRFQDTQSENRTARNESKKSQESQNDRKILESRKGVAKICGQNICLDDSIFKRPNTDSDEEFFAEIDRISDDEEDFKQRLVITNGEKETSGEGTSHQSSNITVIQVSNKDPPHTAIPVLGPETDIFDFEFKQKVTVNESPKPNFVNIVNTEENDYGTTFDSNTNVESDYGHLSLTTTVSLSGVNGSIFQNQSTSNQITNVPTSSQITNLATSNPVTNLATSNQITNVATSNNFQMNASTSNQFQTDIPTSTANETNNRTSNKNEDVYERLCMASTSKKPSPLPVKKLKNVEIRRKSSLPNLEVGDSTYEYLFLSNNNTNAINASPEVNCNGERVNSGSNNDPIERLRSVERSRSQNAYDSSPRIRENVTRRVHDDGSKRDVKNETTEQNPPQKPIWKRGLTELSLLTKLKSIGMNKKQVTGRQDDNNIRTPAVVSPVKVIHRSRPEARVDSARRRSSSLSNGQPPVAVPIPQLITLRARQAASLCADQRRGAALVASISVRDAPIFADYDNQVWMAWWGAAGVRATGRSGDRVASLRGRAPTSAAHAQSLLLANHTPVDILFHRVPLGKIYVLNKRDQEAIGLKLDSECNIVRVEPQGAAARAGLPPAGQWALTEINNRPVNLIKGGDDDMNRLSRHGTEVSVLIQPSPLVKKLRAALKGNKTLLGLR